MKTRHQRLVAVVAMAVTGLLALPIVLAGQNIEEKENLSELLKQRRNTLQQLVTVVTEEYRLGRTKFDSVSQATDQLIDAELELADNNQERITLLERRLDLVESFSTMTEEQFKTGQRTHSELLMAQAAVLEAKIELARERERDGEEAN